MIFPISNLEIYGMEKSIRASKYPMSVDLKMVDKKITDKVMALGQSERGSGHDQFLTGIVAQFDLSFTIKAWTEGERYHFLDFVSSQSTMHRIAKFDLASNDTYNEYVTQEAKENMLRLVEAYNSNPTPDGYLRILYNNPTGFILTAGMTTNYRQLKTIFLQRWDHRLPEWRLFCYQLITQFDNFRNLCIGTNHQDKITRLIENVETTIGL